MPVVRQARRKGWAIVKNVRVLVTSLSQALLKDILLRPKIEHGVLCCHKGEGVRIRINRTVTTHGLLPLVGLGSPRRFPILAIIRLAAIGLNWTGNNSLSL